MSVETGPAKLSDPVRAQSLVEAIVERLEAAIVSGELSPDTRISEQGLARQMGVSRGPLREAMRRLEGRKLIERTPNKGARVTALSPADLEALLVVREALEGMACRLAAEHMSDAEIAALEGLLEKHGALEDVKTGTGYYQESPDFDFHFRIIKASRNERLISILCGDLYHLLRVYRYKSSRTRGRAGQALKEHKRIVGALAARDPDAAEAAMREHLRNARTYAAAGPNTQAAEPKARRRRSR
ncbi:GntR family transcriptional regulator [Rhodoligotrophos ferricapiens]|uniref:GntR family transcriptional regulator n=1 Tax=Rhodoligotrophos ferricapiens TaxID=3069264 RepID=UPI00315DF22A